jgi:DNA-binding transcriptional MerR regulator
MEYLTIQTAAERVGCCAATLRAYERQGAVVPARDSAGRRVYTAADVGRAREVKRDREAARQRAQGEGFARWREARA